MLNFPVLRVVMDRPGCPRRRPNSGLDSKLLVRDGAWLAAPTGRKDVESVAGAGARVRPRQTFLANRLHDRGRLRSQAGRVDRRMDR